jgi:hypothetical protein
VTWDAIVSVDLALAGTVCLMQADLAVVVGVDAAALVGVARLAQANMIVAVGQQEERSPAHTPTVAVGLGTLLSLAVSLLDEMVLAAQ